MIVLYNGIYKKKNIIFAMRSKTYKFNATALGFKLGTEIKILFLHQYFLNLYAPLVYIHECSIILSFSKTDKKSEIAKKIKMGFHFGNETYSFLEK